MENSFIAIFKEIPHAVGVLYVCMYVCMYVCVCVCVCVYVCMYVCMSWMTLFIV